jgi:hypothetical protein
VKPLLNALAGDQKSPNIIISSDCKQVIKDIEDGTGEIYEIVASEMNMETSLIHAGRNLNRESHSLAHYALSGRPGSSQYFD